MKTDYPKDTETLMRPPWILDYSLSGENARKAVEFGLAEADWYRSPVPRDTYLQLLTRKNGPAIRDTLLVILIMGVTGTATVMFWGTWWAVLPYLIYSVFYGTCSDSRWHECGHGTAFRTDWMNNVVYEVASFMVMRESVVWRWSHNRHHSDTIIIGRDPEIQVPRPPSIRALLLSIFAIGVYKAYYSSLIRHFLGRVSDAERSFIPETEFPKMFRNARIILVMYSLVIASAAIMQSLIPVFLVFLPNFFGTWLMIVHNTTQHAGLAENVLDHRLNCRTVYMNFISRFIYWNMNYHLEHHMYPLVPYHALPRLHQLVKDDCPPPYPTILSAWKEIWPAILRQVKDPSYHVRRQLPEPKETPAEGIIVSNAEPDPEGWVEVGASEVLNTEEAIRFDQGKKTYAIHRDIAGKYHATDGICTHGNTHLGDGLVKGTLIECPKHNGRFNLEDGSAARAPVCRGLATYPVEERQGHIWVNVLMAGGAGARSEKSYSLRVVSNKSVSTFIRELVLEPAEMDGKIEFTPGDYLQIEIPEYTEIHFSDLDIPEPYASGWEKEGIFELSSINPGSGRRNNYSMAGNALTEPALTFNVRLAMPPPGEDYPPGTGSSFMFSLKPGDLVNAYGPYGDFHIKPTLKEMVYIGGGSGMAPIRAHIAQLFENDSTERKVSYWYGARSRQDIYYEDYFTGLAGQHPNFNFQVALSEPAEVESWEGHTGFIHDVVHKVYLRDHPNPSGIEFYLCGPPAMIKACTDMLNGLGVKREQISFDEF